MKSKNIFDSFRYASRGIIDALKQERNMKVHTTVALLVLICGLILKLSYFEWLICFLWVILVIGAELINTAIEEAVNVASPKKNEVARLAKDIAAGAVLVFAIGAFISGLIIFIPKIINLFSKVL